MLLYNVRQSNTVSVQEKKNKKHSIYISLGSGPLGQWISFDHKEVRRFFQQVSFDHLFDMLNRGGFSTKPKIYHLLNYLTTLPDCIIYDYYNVRVIHMRGELNIKFCFVSPSAFKGIN